MSDRGYHPTAFPPVNRKDFDDFSDELSRFHDIFDAYNRSGFDIPTSFLVPVIKAMARRIVEIDDRLVRLQARVMTDEGDGR